MVAVEEPDTVPVPPERPDPALQRAVLGLRDLPPLPQALAELTAVLDDGQAGYAALGLEPQTRAMVRSARVHKLEPLRESARTLGDGRR